MVSLEVMIWLAGRLVEEGWRRGEVVAVLNEAETGGGAIYAAASNVSVSRSRFEWNLAGASGGAILHTGGDLDLSDAVLANNRVLLASSLASSAGGGAICARGSSVRVSGRSEVVGNTVPELFDAFDIAGGDITSPGTGGGISLWAQGTLRVTGPVVFARNSARYGGAVFTRESRHPRRPTTPHSFLACQIPRALHTTVQGRALPEVSAFGGLAYSGCHGSYARRCVATPAHPLQNHPFFIESCSILRTLPLLVVSPVAGPPCGLSMRPNPADPPAAISYAAVPNLACATPPGTGCISTLAPPTQPCLPSPKYFDPQPYTIKTEGLKWLWRKPLSMPLFCASCPSPSLSY